ncbi:hypothetical protein bplSymb_SCF01405P005 [Bathymodiolus platifrons methanotrophic gill symbiont]|uniref:capsular polysaccharide export protein, LipB/KpsS family n=1 Tax=Bathymodiolus platifrons methanotrophic gill symbiont TaxID=113268 RepID=UPI000B421560|nr:hypothetical protein [Bathymodiolus platifrons methanotrophic gill symbiont]TXK93130.1 hypothetical protein BMR10_16580 [Methylococcaceae bacterium CS4]TXK93344.1 hypothetical protein BMR11_17100 [Methylococcaceae bacterium CS5]TXL07472.1 hypothetical protein BMR09_05100 [Methylococcaceae bacterium CS3]TXL08105.1 hypothetical protein BMR07_03305 [Methylococcaceae bacterium CS1]TXL08107.1 hypothetical protein BMR07_03315 [Methylococcaceae bacterium CS1]
MKEAEKILLLAFRKSQKKFFLEMLKEEHTENFYLEETRQYIVPSLTALKYISKPDFNPACDFAVDELIAKTSISFPKFILRIFFKILTYITYLRYYKIFDKNFSKVLIWNGGKFRQLIAIEIAKLLNKQVVYFENGLLPNTQVLDLKGINFSNSVPRNKEFYQTYTSDIELPSQLVPRVSKHTEKFNKQEDKLPKEFIFVPFQVDYDTQIITESKFIKNMRALFDVIVELSKETNFHFILKEHPSSGINYPDLHKRVKEFNNITFANSYPTQELIEKSLAVVCINSTVGVESLLLKKKVILLGNAFYKIEGISYGASNIEELKTLFSNFETLEFNEDLVDKFLKYLYNDYLVKTDENLYKNFVHFLK